MLEIFFETFFSLVSLCLNIKDEFLQEKLVKKTREFYHVAQPVNQKELSKALSGLQELVEILIHLKLADPSPALLVQKNLLRFQSEIMGEVKRDTGLRSRPGLQQAGQVGSGTEQIVGYLKNKADGAYAKEIADHLKIQFSRRTVQRYLNELVKKGIIKKDRSDGFPRYFSA